MLFLWAFFIQMVLLATVFSTPLDCGGPCNGAGAVSGLGHSDMRLLQQHQLWPQRSSGAAGSCHDRVL